MIETVWDFIHKYYIYPIIHDSGYNPVNTLTWAVILVLSLFGILKLLDKLDIEIDERLIFSLIPFIYVGSSLRVIEDAEIVSAPLKYLLITPLIYFVIAFFVVLSLVLGYVLNKRFGIDKKVSAFVVGIIISVLNSGVLINYSLDNPINAFVPLKVIFIAITVFIHVYILLKIILKVTKIRNLLDSKLYSLILGVHIFDATSTFVGYSLGATEKHVIPLFFIDLTGTSAVMYPLKVVTIFFGLWMIDSVFREEEDLGTLTLLTLLVLGLAPGLRNTLRLTLGV